MAQSDPGKLRTRFPHPQNAGGMRQPRPHHPGSQAQVIKPIIQAQYGLPQQQQQYMFQTRMPHYNTPQQPQYQTGNYYYPNQGAGHQVFPAYANAQYNPNIYNMPSTGGQIPVSTTNQVQQQQQMAGGWQMHQAGVGAVAGVTGGMHNQTLNQPQQPPPQKKESKRISIRNPVTNKDITDDIVGPRVRSQSGGVNPKQEVAAEPDSSEEKVKQKKEEKEKVINDFKEKITNLAKTGNEQATTTTTVEGDIALDTSKQDISSFSNSTTAQVEDQNIGNDYDIVSLAEASEDPTVATPVTVEPVTNESVSNESVTMEAKPMAVEEVIAPNIESVVETTPELMLNNDAATNGDIETVIEDKSSIGVNNDAQQMEDTLPVNASAGSLPADKPIVEQSCDVPDAQIDDEKPAVTTTVDSVECNDDDPSNPIDDEEATTEAVPFVQVPRKKKQKQRIKEMSAKGEREANGNLMDAFVDKPEEEINAPPSVEPKEDVFVPTEQPKEEETWEEKEEFEVENAIKPTTNGSTQLDDNDDDNADKKRQYSRDFLLQFAKNCTIKPDGLPEMDIVLKKPHCLTEPLNQDQRQDYNDFAPQYCRQQSGGGRHSGAGRQKGSRGGYAVPAPPPKKIIAAPIVSNVELRRTEHKWVRPSEQKKDLDQAELEKEETYRKTRGILNKLTPQNFETLLTQMKELKIQSYEQMKVVIEIVFEKAISEPGFSVAYARMCQELSETKISSEDKTFTFRGLLLNRCQQEFMKEREVEQQMLVDKDKKFDTPEEAQQWKEIVELKEMKARRSALGNVRFIGELYKLKMLKESIMHECINTLLTKNDEEYLEWVSKLLTTIGQGLSQTTNPDCKIKMGQYFDQLSILCKDKKISSRVRFMLQDLIELKDNHWVPRREDSNPKTIDQLREDMKTKNKQQEIASKMDRNDRRNRGDNRGDNRGGRDSPVTGKQGNNQGDGWVTSSGRKGKAPATQVDANKFKAIRSQQMSNSEVSLGPSRGLQTWAKGSSGGSTNFGNGPSQPQEPRTSNNRFGLLDMSDGRQDVGDSRDRQSRGKRSAEQERERASAISATRQFARSSPRSQSPAMKTTEDRPKKNNTPAPPPEVPMISDDKLENSTRAIVKEYLCNFDTKEAIICVKDLKVTSKHHLIMSTMIGDAVDGRPKDCEHTGVLLDALLNGVISKEAFTEGLQSLLSQSNDIIVDIPHFWNMLGTLFCTAVSNNTINLCDLRKIAESSLDNRASLGLYMAEILAAVVKKSSEKQALELWQKSAIKWDMLFKDNAKLEDVLKKTKLQFTINITPRLPIELFNSDGTNEEKLLQWLKENVESSQKPNADLINDISFAVCRVSVLEGTKFTKTPFEQYTNLLRDYITPYEDYRLNLLHVAQKVADSLDYPKGLLREMFEALYGIEIVEDSTVYEWESSKEVSYRKNVALVDVETFLGWIHSTDDSHSTKDDNDQQ